MPITTRKFTINQYHQMVNVGILTPQDRVELIQGEIIEMSPIGLKHAACVNLLANLFPQKLGTQIIVSVQNPIQLNDYSEPQSDVVLLKPLPDFYGLEIAKSKDIYLLIEVADTTITTIKYDKEVKLPLYAVSSIPEVWIIDLNSQCVEVYLQPHQNMYQNYSKFNPGQKLSCLNFPNLNIDVNDLLVFTY
ncbi:MAG TPA: Uma2 family endonuclease [Cyanothece sp. UBA12306]|nr:Uma2 family endonuclease [Cyanothece sp. UBA12306]